MNLRQKILLRFLLTPIILLVLLLFLTGTPFLVFSEYARFTALRTLTAQGILIALVPFFFFILLSYKFLQNRFRIARKNRVRTAEEFISFSMVYAVISFFLLEAGFAGLGLFLLDLRNPNSFLWFQLTALGFALTFSALNFLLLLRQNRRFTFLLLRQGRFPESPREFRKAVTQILPAALLLLFVSSAFLLNDLGTIRSSLALESYSRVLSPEKTKDAASSRIRDIRKSSVNAFKKKALLIDITALPETPPFSLKGRKNNALLRLFFLLFYLFSVWLSAEIYTRPGLPEKKFLKQLRETGKPRILHKLFGAPFAGEPVLFLKDYSRYAGRLRLRMLRSEDEIQDIETRLERIRNTSDRQTEVIEKFRSLYRDIRQMIRLYLNDFPVFNQYTNDLKKMTEEIALNTQEEETRLGEVTDQLALLPSSAEPALRKTEEYREQSKNFRLNLEKNIRFIHETKQLIQEFLHTSRDISARIQKIKQTTLETNTFAINTSLEASYTDSSVFSREKEQMRVPDHIRRLSEVVVTSVQQIFTLTSRVRKESKNILLSLEQVLKTFDSLRSCTPETDRFRNESDTVLRRQNSRIREIHAARPSPCTDSALPPNEQALSSRLYLKTESRISKLLEQLQELSSKEETLKSILKELKSR